MDHLPVFLDISGRLVVVDGGQTVAARRVERALSAGAIVASFDPKPGGELTALFGHKNLTHQARVPESSDFEGCAVAYGASEDAVRDKLLANAARQAGALCNVADVPEYCDFITPSVVERDPITIAISTGGAAPVIARNLRARIEAMLPEGYGRLAAYAAGFRDRIAAAIPDGRGRRRFWEDMIEGQAGDLFLAGFEDDATAQISAGLEAAGNAAPLTGEAWLVGAGPGDPDLLTFKALRLMQHADIVLYDRLIGPGILELSRRDAERINVGKSAGSHAMGQDEITALIIKLAKDGNRVLRLKGGDPFIFGRGGEELEEVAVAGIPVQVVPGITAAAGCGACAGIPLTHRDHAQSVAFVTAHGAGGVLDHDWTKLARPGQTLVVYMGLGSLGAIATSALAQGVRANLPVAVIDNGSRLNQTVVTATLETIEGEAGAADLGGPALIIMGDVVTMRDKLNVDGIREQQVSLGLDAREGL
ncbi:MAG: uroporphyrinogen-III C-methyltransferase [Rhodobacteraceae bacterium]|nr:uroporphyrinogen-III C-methyltransferase [Paracoccaceae bacterium]